jgi:pyruvate, water dikinase
MTPKQKEKIILKGIPASAGKVRGRVKIINFPEEIDELKDCEIIVVPFLIPSFLDVIRRNNQILGIISDRGGLTSHAAILTRELEIPYIAGTQNATKKLKDGTMITMDGSNGFIYE